MAQGYTYPYPMAAPGAGVIFYQRNKLGSLLVGSAQRAARVGAGFGISAGGFAELAPLLAARVGTVRNLIEDAWREMMEELPGVETILPRELFYRDAQLLLAQVVRTSDDNTLHTGCYFALPVSEEQRVALQALPASEETSEALGFYELTWTKTPHGKVESSLNIPGEFYHAHEREAFHALAECDALGRLWA